MKRTKERGFGILIVVRRVGFCVRSVAREERCHAFDVAGAVVSVSWKSRVTHSL